MNTITAQHLMSNEERARYRDLASSKRTGAERIFDQLRASQIAMTALERREPRR